MSISGIVIRYVVIGCALLLGACGGGGDGGDGGGNANAPPPPSSGIGPAGGTVIGPNGSKVVIPPGALAVTTPIKIEQVSTGLAPLPAGFPQFGPMFEFTPHGTTFAVPVTVTLPFDQAGVPAGTEPQFFKTNAQNQWQRIPNAVFGATSVSAEMTSFSDDVVVVPPLQRNNPVRDWRFFAHQGGGGPAKLLEPPNHGGIQPGDLPSGAALDDKVEFGPAFFDAVIFDFNQALPSDQIANGQVVGSANGVTYYVFAEAPDAPLGGPDPVGSIVTLKQTQSFIKRSADATLKFTLTKAVIVLTDFNTPLLRGVAPIKGELLFAVQAYETPDTDPFFYTAARASVFGEDGHFFHTAQDESFSRVHLWDDDDFNFATRPIGFTLVNGVPTLGPTNGIIEAGACPGTMAALELKQAHTFVVDLSHLDVGDEFTLRADAHADVYNRKGGGFPPDCEAASATAFLRDPSSIDGTTIEFTGLEPTNRPLPSPPEPALVEPASCVSGPSPNPAAGVLQFDAATYTVDELSSAVPTVTVTRTGGSTGAVTASFTTSDGTASGDSDYTPLNATVFFGDGEEGERVVNVPITPDFLAELDETVNLSLSQPGGCADLGARTAAVLTIRDDREILPPQPSGLDPTFGNAGKVGTAFGGDDTAMALQPDGKIVIVGGSTSDFELARFNANGTLDDDFGSHGRVVTSILSGITEEIARAVAIQPDGKIVVAGFTGQFGRPGRPAGNRFDHAIVRYNANGSVDTTFGNGGVASSLIGRIFAMALQPDGGIIVVGDAPLPEDMMVARYGADGDLDLNFGEGGFRLFDLSLGAELAENVAVQSNGAIVLSGPHTKDGETVREQHTAVVRLDSGGDPDATFGTAGVLVLDNTRVGDGLAVQSDGRIVLVGDADTVTAGVSQFATMRLNSNGTPDSSFGTGGRVNTAVTTRSDTARAVALQPDGKIIVAGSSSNQTNPNFAAVRYNANGTLDASFGTASMLTVDFFGFTDIAENVAVQGDGKIVLGGLARNNVDGYGLARVNP